MIAAIRSDPVLQANKSRVVLVLLEVLLLTLLVPVARVGFKHLTPDGLLRATLLRIGVGMVGVALAVCLLLAVRRKTFKAYGAILSGWRDGLRIGTILSLISAIAVVASMPVFQWTGVGHFTGREVQARVVAMGFALASLALFVWVLRSYEFITKRIPTVLVCILQFGLWATPLLLIQYFDRDFSAALIIFVNAIVVAGVGEEFVFRGYIQSRLNEILGRPFHLVGIQFGWGLLIAAFLFGFVHIFNGVDFIDGSFGFQWVWGIGGVVQGLFLGYLREKTGSILAGAVLHGNADAWQLIVGNLK